MACSDPLYRYVGTVVGAAAVLNIRGDIVDQGMESSWTAEIDTESHGPDTAASATPIPADSTQQEALTQLTRIERAAAVRATSLKLLDVAGCDLNGIARIAAVLPLVDRLNSTFDAIASCAVRDPAGAVGLALALDDLPARAEAIKRVARVLGRLDPRTALAYGEAIDSYEFGDAFRNSVFEEWASNDPDGFLDFVESAATADVRGAGDAFAIAAASRPTNALALLDRIPQAARLTAERAVLDVLVRTNTGAALAYIDGLPFGNMRDSLQLSTAQSYAEHDLEAALAWADSLQPPSASATTGVLWVLAKSDPVRGAEVLIEKLVATGGTNAAVNANRLLQAFTPGPRDLMSLVAERLSRADDTVVRTAYDGFMNDWSRNDSEAAIDWALANPERLTLSSVVYLARNSSITSPELAKQTADRVPPDMRGTWIRVVASRLAQANLDDALVWISRYQGQPVYEEALGSALHLASLTGSVETPEALALFLDRQSADVRADSVAVVANIWAERDPAAAARWVERTEFADEVKEGRRSAAISNVAARWAARDATAAENWALGLTEGEARDRALGSVLSVTSRSGRIDARLIQAFSFDAVAQRSLAGMAIANLGRSDPDLGRELIERHITDPAIRGQAEQELIKGVSGQPYGTAISVR